jgi:hypothetical protein
LVDRWKPRSPNAIEKIVTALGVLEAKIEADAERVA